MVVKIWGSIEPHLEPCRRKGSPQISVSGQIRQQPQPSLQPSAVLSYKDRQLISTTYCFQQNLLRLQSESCGLQTILWMALLPETRSHALIIHACHFAFRPKCDPPQQFLVFRNWRVAGWRSIFPNPCNSWELVLSSNKRKATFSCPWSTTGHSIKLRSVINLVIF